MIEKAALHPNHVRRLISIRNKIYCKIGELSCEVSTSKEPVKKADIEKLDFKELKIGEPWGNQFGCAWFKFNGNIPKDGKGKHVVALINMQGEGVVYNNDKVQQGITQVLDGVDMVQSACGKQVVELFNCSEGNEKIELLVDAGYNGKGSKHRKADKIVKLVRKDIAICNDDVLTYYYDYLQLFTLTLTYGKNELLTKEKVSEIMKALNLSYRQSKKDYKLAHSTLEKIIVTPLQKKATEYTAIGHAHIDLAWLWPIRETKRKGVRTFATAINNMKKYPNYKFGASQAQLFDWVKSEAPDLFEETKKAVQNDRMEIQGGMWCENDCNIPSGESIIRQFVYGERFFVDEFGKSSKMVWLPDVFGYPASLPQIFKKCDKEYFMTIKLTWNNQNRFPYKTFMWEGIDGTSILSHMAPQGNYNSTASPFAIVKSEKGFNQKDKLDKALLIYGIGDGGGGPGEAPIELVTRYKNEDGINNVVPGFAEEFFDKMNDSYLDRIPTFNGELYLEKHQGTYTSQAKSKLYNRKIENDLHTLEWICSIAKLKNIDYDQKVIDEIWKEVLLYQFHDIIPGSSIKRVYDESHARYEILEEQIKSIREGLMSKISNKNELTVLNTIDFKREEYIKNDNKWYKVNVNPYSSAKLEKAADDNYELECGDNFISNNKVKIVFGSNGEIVSYKDKEHNVELAKGPLNNLVVYSDPDMHYNAWDIDINYINLKKDTMELISSKIFIDGPRVVVDNVFVYNRSRLEQKLYLYEGSSEIVCDTSVEWNESYKMLRVNFEPSVYSDTVNCDIQFGNVNRSTKNENSIEKAQFEVCAHKFVNVDDVKQNCGVTVMSDCKYGYRVKDGMISLNLLRSPKWPDNTCDMGMHKFKYVFYPHNNLWQDSDVVKKAYELNNPLIITNYGLELDSMVKLDSEGVILETIKVAEDQKGIVLRIYERYGKNCKVNIKPQFSHKKVYETNMIETSRKEISSLDAEFTAYEIKTYYIEL